MTSRYIPHTEADITRMLGVVGKPSVASLFAHVPDRLRATRPLDIEPLDERALIAHLAEIGRHTNAAMSDGVLSFLGGGLIPHHIPAAVDMLLMRSEWYTSYTPYQPEVSQGTLQAVFEFQTIVSELLGLPVANASMYDGASAAAEALLMARRITGKKKSILAGLHPHYDQTIETYLSGMSDTGLHRIPHAFAGGQGQISLAALDDALAATDVACVVVQTPDFFGVVQDLRAIAERAHAHGALVVAVTTEPLALGLLASPGALGADIAVAEGIGLAIPPSLGGPGVGLFATRTEYTRQLPGRLVGETVDETGKRGYVLTLSTREQHIRREKATSNICTNQGLIALAFTIHLSLLGRRGFRQLAELNLAKSEYAKAKIAALPGFSLPLTAPTFNEFVVKTPLSPAQLDHLARQNIFAGVRPAAAGLHGPHKGVDDLLLVAVTERHEKADIDRLVAALRDAGGGR